MMDLHCCETADNEVKAVVDKVLLHDDRVVPNMIHIEEKYTPTFTSASATIQVEVTPKMIDTVTNWMMEVTDEQECQEEVFQLSVNYLHRFLLLCCIKKNQLQLLGAVCMMLASKFRETRPLNADTLVYYTDHSITKEMLRRWELLVLSKLKWDIAAIVPVDFLPHLLTKLPVKDLGICCERAKNHAKILITLSAKEFQFAGYHPSVIACASVASALCGLGWTTKCHQSLEDLLEMLYQCTSVDKEFIRNCMTKIDSMVQRLDKVKTTSDNTDEPVGRPEQMSPPLEKMYKYGTAVTPTDVYEVRF